MRQERVITFDRSSEAAGRTANALALPRLRQAARKPAADHPAQRRRGWPRHSVPYAVGPAPGASSPGLQSESPVPNLPLAAKPLDDERRRLLDALASARLEPQLGFRICSSYGPGASIVFDFGLRKAIADLDAWHRLRLQHELPHPSGAEPPRRDAVTRELDLALWETGYAAGDFALRDAAPDWWHTRLVENQIEAAARYSKLPLHLELARALASGPITPCQLRRTCRPTLHELRCFIQAGLFLGLLQWDRPARCRTECASPGPPGPA